MSYFHIIWIVDVYCAFVKGGKLNSIFVFGWYESRSHRIGAHDFVGVGAEMSQRYMHLVIDDSVCIFFYGFVIVERLRCGRIPINENSKFGLIAWIVFWVVHVNM